MQAVIQTKKYSRYALIYDARLVYNISVKKIFYPAKYTYEEYKAIMDKKKAEKQEKKKQKLQRQLNRLDKTE